MTAAANREQLQLARASYERCQQVPDFFRRFYDHLLASDPEIPGFFTHTKFEKQDRLLEHGILLLLIYAKRSEKALLTGLAARHGPSGLNVPARLFPMFITSFLATVQQCDQACDKATVEAWEAALRPGIAFICGSP